MAAAAQRAVPRRQPALSLLPLRPRLPREAHLPLPLAVQQGWPNLDLKFVTSRPQLKILVIFSQLTILDIWCTYKFFLDNSVDRYESDLTCR